MEALTERDGEYKYRGPTFGDFVTIRTEASMQDITVARKQSKCNVLRESLSVDSQNIPCAALNRRWSWVIFAYLCPNLAQDL
jgi:hypothetical protein